MVNSSTCLWTKDLQRQIDTYIPSDYRGVKYNFYFKMGVGAKI